MKLLHIKKIGKNKYEIELENKKIKTYDTVILNHQVILKKELSEELIEKIENETKKAEQIEKAIQFINRKQRSEKEVRDYLSKQGLENVDEIIEYLKSRHLFNEDTYIEAYIHDRFFLSPTGPNKIKEELLKNNFEEEKVMIGLGKLEEKEIQEKLEKLITKKINANHKYSSNYCKQKILDQMILLGYSKEMITELLEKGELNHDDILKHDANKLYQKYKNKKEGNELWLCLKQKLYQKQYPIEEINEVLEIIAQENSIL